MSPAFIRALEKTLAWEGGYSSRPDDLGGPTNYGITQKTYDRWRTTTGSPKRPVDDITDTEVQAIYHDNYWLPCNCDQIPEPLSHCVFDMAVNCGVWNAKISLQQAASVRQDGVIGPVTLSTINGTPNVLLRFLKRRASYYAEIVQTRPSQAVFLPGWINRILDQAWSAR